MYADGPLVVAHRGSSSLLAEHTLAAYEHAVAVGADGLECDVRLTRDGHLVCVHDRRLERTSDGRGAVSDRSLADLHTLDFGSWKLDLPENADQLVTEWRDRRPPVPDDPWDDRIRDAHRRVLTFERLLELVVDCGRPIRLYVETKHPTRWAGLVEQRLIATLRRFGLVTPEARYRSVRRAGPPPEDGRVVLMSFSPLAVRRLRELAPSLPVVLLFDGVPLLARDGVLPFGARIAGPGLHVLRARPGFAQRVHQAGNRLYVWTIDEPDDADFVLGLGADVIATNRPAEMLTRLGRGNTETTATP